MKRCLHSFVCLVVALHLVGGHWGIMQMVAWASMLRDYTEERGLVTGVKETFDGDHACGMCKKIAEQKGEEERKRLPLRKSTQDSLLKWFGVSPAATLPGLRHEEHAAEVRNDALMAHATSWDTPPPVPPPRGAA